MNKAIIVVDMLNDFMPESIYPEAELPVEPADQIIEPIKQVVQEAREQSIPVFYLNELHEPGDKDLEEWGEHCLKGTEGAEVISELEPKEKDVIILKKTTVVSRTRS